jgi:hypothetical protein
MRWGDALWLLVVAGVASLLLVPVTRVAFVSLTGSYPYPLGFMKFFILASMGELLTLRLLKRRWTAPRGLVFRALVWGLIGVANVLVFEVLATGVASAQAKGLLPGRGSHLAFAFFVSTIMNLTFGAGMMLTHRVLDTFIDMCFEQPRQGIRISDVIARVDWQGFVSFVLLRTIPLYWIPAHTITFLLPPEYRVLMAAFLSITLGAILSFAKRKPRPRSAST